MKHLILTALVLKLTLSMDAAVPFFDREQLLRDLKVLSADDMQGRKTNTAGAAKARAYILRRFQELGPKPFHDKFEHEFPFVYPKDKNRVQQKGINVIGTIPGKHSRRTIAITAHYDHLGNSKGVLYNGADDNASGVAALLAVASHFGKHPPQNSFVIAALDAEEYSGAGGEALLPSLDKKQLVLNVNLDMVGRDANNVLYAAGLHHYPCLRPSIEKVAASAPVTLRPGHDRPGLKDVEDWTQDSDHYAFHKRGIPFLYFGVEDYEHHHKPTDDYENMTHDFFANAVTTIILAVQQFDADLEQIQAATSNGTCR
jgi:Zn-dependent M28 family amino/carboxypeptidase